MWTQIIFAMPCCDIADPDVAEVEDVAVPVLTTCYVSLRARPPPQCWGGEMTGG